jgi:hypothetical protein
MTPYSLYHHLIDSGFSIRAEGENLWVSPREKLTPDQVAAIKANKQALIAFANPDPLDAQLADIAYHIDWDSGDGKPLDTEDPPILGMVKDLVVLRWEGEEPMILSPSELFDLELLKEDAKARAIKRTKKKTKAKASLFGDDQHV